MAFSPDYVRLVLQENFDDAKALFLDVLMAVHYAHLVMLAETGIIPREDARALRAALRGIDLEAVRRARYDGTCEDLFFHLDARIIDGCGPAVAGRLHTARSRNDIDMTMYRMRVRAAVLTLTDTVLAVRRALMATASRHVDTIFPAHTHAQPAQPTTVAHYVLGVAEQLERDTRRLAAAYETTNCCPLGACAITGTGFPIDRARTSALLGFARPTGNTYGSIAAVDYLLESASAAGVLLAGLGRFVQDLLLWSTREMGYLRLPDGFVQVSSIMPQKRNPVALEHALALASRALAETSAIAHVVHNTPWGDIVDTEDDLQPLVSAGFRNAMRATGLVAAVCAHMEFDAARMRKRADEGWVTVTELADALVRERGLPFTRAHAIVTAFLARAGARGPEAVRVLNDVARELGEEAGFTDVDLERYLSPEHFVAVRRTPGGPAPDVVRPAIDDATARLEADAAWARAAGAALTAADAARASAVDAL